MIYYAFDATQRYTQVFIRSSDFNPMRLIKQNLKYKNIEFNLYKGIFQYRIEVIQPIDMAHFRIFNELDIKTGNDLELVIIH